MSDQEYTGVFRHVGGTARRVKITNDPTHRDRFIYDYESWGVFGGAGSPIAKTEWMRLVDEKWWVPDDPLMQLSEGF